MLDVDFIAPLPRSAASTLELFKVQPALVLRGRPQEFLGWFMEFNAPIDSYCERRGSGGLQTIRPSGVLSGALTLPSTLPYSISPPSKSDRHGWDRTHFFQVNSGAR